MSDVTKMSNLILINEFEYLTILAHDKKVQLPSQINLKKELWRRLNNDRP